MRRLLIQADDFGLTEGVTRGITEAATLGVVTGTSAMVCSPEHRERVARAGSKLAGRIGLHLQLTDGKPLTDPARIPTLVDAEGRFAAHRSNLTDLRMEEVLLEWRAQWRALEDLGISPSHIDCHHHVHAVPAALQAYVQLAKENNVPARVLPEGVGGSPRQVRDSLSAAGVACADFFVCVWTGAIPELGSIMRALRVFARIGGDNCLLEIGCHPGYAAKELETVSKYSCLREEELRILLSPETRSCIEQAGWTLTNAEEVY